MRILIDECIDERFRNSFSNHDCQTARYAGLAGLQNGELLTAAQTAKFDVFLTVDQGIEYQQNLAGRTRSKMDPSFFTWTCAEMPPSCGKTTVAIIPGGCSLQTANVWQSKVLA